MGSLNFVTVLGRRKLQNTIAIVILKMIIYILDNQYGGEGEGGVSGNNKYK